MAVCDYNCFECIHDDCIQGNTRTNAVNPKKSMEENKTFDRAKYDKEYKLKNKEKLAEYNKRYYLENKERLTKYHKNYRAMFKKRIAKNKAERYERDKEKIAEYYKQYYSDNRELIRARSKAYYEKMKAEKGLI